MKQNIKSNSISNNNTNITISQVDYQTKEKEFLSLLKEKILQNDIFFQEYIIGLSRNYLNINMRKFVNQFSIKDNKQICLLNKNKIINEVIKVCYFIYKSARDHKEIVLFGLNYVFMEIIQKISISSDIFFINNKCYGGFFTNFRQESFKNILDVKRLEQYFKNNDNVKNIAKKKVNVWKKTFIKYKRMLKFFNGFLHKNIKYKQKIDIVIFLGYRRIKNFIRECNDKNIFSINISDVNSSASSNMILPLGLNYLIDNHRFNELNFLLFLIHDSIVCGKNVFTKKLNSEIFILKNNNETNK